MRRVVVVLGLLALVSGCVPRPTAEDRRRGDILRADPIFSAEIPGVDEGTVYVTLGHGSGATRATTDVRQEVPLVGDPQDALRVAVARARADGWSIQSVACQTSATRPTTYLVYGVKQFDGFVGSLVIEAFVSQPDGLQRFLLQASASDADTGSRGESITPSQTASTIGPAVGTCLDQ